MFHCLMFGGNPGPRGGWACREGATTLSTSRRGPSVGCSCESEAEGSDCRKAAERSGHSMVVILTRTSRFAGKGLKMDDCVRCYELVIMRGLWVEPGNRNSNRTN